MIPKRILEVLTVIGVSAQAISFSPPALLLAAEQEGPFGVQFDERGPKDPLLDALDNMPAERPHLPPPEGAIRLTPPTAADRIWIDKAKQQLIVDGYVTLQEGYLEMFACPVGTKEHESVVAVESRAFIIHTGLLALGAKPGNTAIFMPQLRPVLAYDFFFSDLVTRFTTPDFFPPTGTEIEVSVQWRDQQGQWQHARAQDWVLDGTTEKPMTQPWVFAGSGFWLDERTGKEHYLAESGDLICVSNFSTAMLDIPIESSNTNDGLIFQANKALIPPIGTPVQVVLRPLVKKAAE
ncbi:YdjY domain-containing protein [Adhaeretor mobilis]|uniref:Uncharacterized protein n=1 Tax=Adhaeretor mobilis TaxID=1930276 RepID=A0A517MVX3_9BACT|nr:YdjY domain-containing protein [Adhaeretor mobilis]QDS99035.1 hypothetical protein HG15A2_23240 [Adhaeretor mobilis]